MNNDGTFYPRLTTSYTSELTSQSKLHDGNYWYMRHPPNRWTSYELPNAHDWLEIDFGSEKEFSRVEMAIYDDRGGVQALIDYVIQKWESGNWKTTSETSRSPAKPTGVQWNTATFPSQKSSKLRFLFTNRSEIMVVDLAKDP